MILQKSVSRTLAYPWQYVLCNLLPWLYTATDVACTDAPPSPSPSPSCSPSARSAAAPTSRAERRAGPAASA